MSDTAPAILFEYPLNEKMRTWLRLEFLLQQLLQHRPQCDTSGALTFFRTLSDLLDVLDRGEVRAELLKELEHQQRKLMQWINVPGVDQEMIHALSQHLKQQAAILMAAPRIGQTLREDRLVALVRQRLGIPGGCCSFDPPTLYLWLNLDQTTRDRQIDAWIASLAPLTDSLMLVLDLLRKAATFKPMTSLHGFYQDNADGTEMLRIQLALDLQIYPQVSGHKSRFAIRFLPLDSEQGVVPDRLSFNLACC
ncbi:cell division protein ZapD [Edwardsiella ictaluri]|uniref:cell division protein ZapD n=1 Tax=Edwardsiella ictaluri TaxID=67780 RepID=UPI00378422AA